MLHCEDYVTGGKGERAFTFYQMSPGFSDDACQTLDAANFIPTGGSYSHFDEPFIGYIFRGDE